MEKIRYFDHAATTAVKEEVLKEMLPYFGIEYGNASSMYSIGRRAKKAIDEKNDTELFAKKDELEKVYGPIITRIYQENAPKDANGNPQVDPNMFNNMFGGQGGNGQNPFGGNPFQAGAPFTETK